MKKEIKKKKVLTTEEKKEILSNSADIIYKFCHKNKSKYRHNYENFEEFISECIIFAYDYIDKWDPERSALSTYLYTTLPWRIQNAKRKERRKPKDYSLEEIVESGKGYEAFEEEILRLEEIDRDNKILDLIIPILHNYTRAHYLEGKSYNQISEETGEKVGKIKSIVYKDLEKLRGVVEDEIE